MSLIIGQVLYNTLSPNCIDPIEVMYSTVKNFPHEKHNLLKHLFVKFCHLLTYNTIESIHENLPVYLQEQQLLFTVAARIDNRAQLAQQLNIKIHPQYPDGKLVLQAYLRWGKNCVHYLRGDWIFAIYDFAEQELFIARDQTGCTSLYYYQDDTGFYFSSSIKSLLALPNYKVQLNELHFVKYLTLWDNLKIDHDTFYENIYSLPQAHSISVKNKIIDLEKYWHPENLPLIYHKDKNVYVREMLERFTNAVQVRLRSFKPVASMLSGGLDSSTVSFIAAQLNQNKPLTTISHVPLFTKELLNDSERKHRILDETPFILDVAKAAGNIEPILLNSSNYTVLEGMTDFLKIFDMPAHGAVNLYWGMDIYKTAKKIGVGSLLTGEGGNGTISFNGLAYLLPFNINRLVQHPYSYFKKQIAKPIAIKYFRKWINKVSNSSNDLNKYISNIFIQDSILKKYDILEQVKNANVDYFLYKHVNELKKIHVDLYDARGTSGSTISQYYGIEQRDPTVDADLVEYFFSIPNEVFFDEHYNRRMLVKNMMRRQMPDSVLFEKKKGLQSADISYRVKAQEAEITATIESVKTSPAANHYINMTELHHTWQQYLKQPYVAPYSYQNLLKALHFAMFLQMNFD